MFSLLISAAEATNWQLAKLRYIQQINGRDYPAEVILLRPESYFTENKATKVGDELTVDLPEMGLDNVAMDIISIEPFKGISTKENGTEIYEQIDEINWDNKTNRPVTGTFKRYAKEVYTYKFRNIKTGEVSTINATPNHPFYVVNKHDYVPISEIRAKDKLLSQTGEQVKLICTSPEANCGTRYNLDNTPTLVYNFEVYQQHRYYIANKDSKQGLLVHNPCFNDEIQKVLSEPNHTLQTDVVISEGSYKTISYTIDDFPYKYLERTTMPYIYRADRKPLSIIKIDGGFKPSEIFADFMFEDTDTPVLIGSRSAVGAYKYGYSDIDEAFTIYRINTSGIPVISLEESIKHLKMFEGYPREMIFKGSYISGWDEVHALMPISLDRISVVAEFGIKNTRKPIN